MKNINEIEMAILQAIIDENKRNYPFLEEHLPYLYVKNREYTNVGAYINFAYAKRFAPKNINILLSSDKKLVADNLENELAYIIDITDGRFNFLEITSNGEDMLDKDCIMHLQLV